MAKTAAKASKRPSKGTRPGPKGQRGRPTTPASFLSRNAIWLGFGLIAILAGILLMMSRDGGETSDSGTGGFTGGDFHSMVVDPSNPQRLFVGGHQAVSVSEDGGATWTEVTELRDADAMGWAFADDAIFVSGHPGLNRSSDDGATFERINEGLPHTDLHAFGGSGDVLYGAATGSGVFVGTSPGAEWEIVNESVGQSFFGRILVGPDDPEQLIAADAAAGVASSNDGGRTWELLDSGLPNATWVSRGGTDQDLIVASGPSGASVSTDGGESWSLLDIPNGVTIVEAVPGEDDVLYAGRHDGSNVEVLVSRDGGETWARATADEAGS